MNNPRNELSSEHLSINSLNPFSKHNSASRSVMFSSHFSQRLVIDGADEKYVQTGLEKEMSKYTFNVKMPENGKIIKVIERYPKGIGQDTIPENPETIVIYENEDTREIDFFSIPYFASFHQYFGFKYKPTEAINQIRPGAYIEKGTVFADSPAVAANGGYKYGINLNMALMSHPAVTEDGIMICRDALPKLRFKLYETRVVEFGSTHFPLNLYGNHEVYKPFKEIGEYLNDDGLLMMLRPYDDELSPIDLSIYDVMEPDYTFDKGIYVRGGKGRIVDIKVVSNNKPKILPEGMTQQVTKYEKAMLNFYREIVTTEEQLRMDRKRKFGDGSMKLSPKFHRLIVEALVVSGHNPNKLKQQLNLIYRKAPIDEYRVEFVVEYEMTPNIGYKLTDLSGGLVFNIKSLLL